MQFLAVIERKIGEFSEQEFERLLEPEAEHVRKLYSEGVFRSVFSRGDIKGAVVQMECESREEASRILASLPFAAAGMIHVQIIPLLPYRGFAPRSS